MKYLIKTYGCQMNVHESEKLAGILENMGYSETQEEINADIILFNTCAIRESAEQKIFAHIGELKKLKKEKPNMIIAICGCMSQQGSYPENILKKFPFVDIIFGTHNISKLEEFIKKRKAKKKKVVSIEETENIIERDTMPKKRTSGIKLIPYPSSIELRLPYLAEIRSTVQISAGLPAAAPIHDTSWFPH